MIQTTTTTTTTTNKNFTLSSTSFQSLIHNYPWILKVPDTQGTRHNFSSFLESNFTPMPPTSQPSPPTSLLENIKILRDKKTGGASSINHGVFWIPNSRMIWCGDELKEKAQPTF
jgi:hypothetical protein